jgi:hypothetical protein
MSWIWFEILDLFTATRDGFGELNEEIMHTINTSPREEVDFTTYYKNLSWLEILFSTSLNKNEINQNIKKELSKTFVKEMEKYNLVFDICKKSN